MNHAYHWDAADRHAKEAELRLRLHREEKDVVTATEAVAHALLASFHNDRAAAIREMHKPPSR